MSETPDEHLMSINEQQNDYDETADESFFSMSQEEIVVEDGIVTKSDDENYINGENDLGNQYEEIDDEETVPKEDEEEEIEEEEMEEEDEDSSSVLANGLDPMATHLISSSSIVTPSNLQQTTENEIIISKINREVRNLQINTNNSGDLYSSLSFDSPRRAKKVIDKLTPDDVIEDMDDEEKSSDKETSKSPSLERLAVSSTSDSTTRKDSPLKSNGTRMKSKVYTRTPVKKRKRTITSQLNDEISINSDREDQNEDDDHDDETESEPRSEIINQTSFESRSIKQPPKVSDFLDLNIFHFIKTILFIGWMGLILF